MAILISKVTQSDQNEADHPTSTACPVKTPGDPILIFSVFTSNITKITYTEFREFRRLPSFQGHDFKVTTKVNFIFARTCLTWN